MTDFVIATVRNAAEHAIELAEVIHLPLADQACFAQASFEATALPDRRRLEKLFGRVYTVFGTPVHKRIVPAILGGT